MRPSLSLAVLVSLFCFGGCPTRDSDDDSVPGDDVTGDDDTTDAPEDCDDANTLGHFSLFSNGTSGGFTGIFWEAPLPWSPEPLIEAGDCTLYGTEAPPLCDPPCESPDVCVADDVCEPWPGFVSAGTLTISGTTPSFHVEAGESNYYSWYASEVDPAALFAPGAPITLRAAGSPVVEAFELMASGVELWPEGVLELAMESGQPLDVTWEPAGPPSSAGVWLQLGSDHHALMGVSVTCEAPDAQGHLTVSAEIIDELITGAVTEHHAHMQRRTVAVEPHVPGCVELIVAAQRDVTLVSREE